MSDVLLVSFVGALISLDRTAFLQIMISQPIVAGTIIGFTLGAPVTGLIIGSALELLWIGTVPVGGSVPPNETVAAVIATAISIMAGSGMGLVQPPPLSLTAFSILLSIPLAILGQRVDIFVRNYNRRFALKADRLLESGDFSEIGRQNLKGLVSFFTASFFSLMVLLGLGLLVTKALYPLFPDYIMKCLPVIFYLLISLGIAVSIRTAKGRRAGSLLAAGFLAGMGFIYLRG